MMCSQAVKGHSSFWGWGNSVWLEHGLCHQRGVKAEEGTLSQGWKGWLFCAKVCGY